MSIMMPDMKVKRVDDKKKGKPKAHPPSHLTTGSCGPAVNTVNPAALQLGDKNNIKPGGLKRRSLDPIDAPSLNKKFKRLNLPTTSDKESKVMVTPAHLNVNKKNFGEAAKRDLMTEGRGFKVDRRLLHNSVKERVPPTPVSTKQPPVLDKLMAKTNGLKRPRSGPSDAPSSNKKFKRRDMPSTSDKERKVKVPPVYSVEVQSILDAIKFPPLPNIKIMKKKPKPVDSSSQQTAAPAQVDSSKRPPVLANLKAYLNNKSRSTQTKNTTSNPGAPAVNVQELLLSIMPAFGIKSIEDVIKQSDFSDQVKWLSDSQQLTLYKN